MESILQKTHNDSPPILVVGVGWWTLNEADFNGCFSHGLQKYFSYLIGDKIEMMKNGVHGYFSHGPQNLITPKLREKWEYFGEKWEKNKITMLFLILKINVKNCSLYISTLLQISISVLLFYFLSNKRKYTLDFHHLTALSST